MPEILGEALEFEMGNAAVIVNVKGDVKSVNGKTGVVVLKTSDLENDSGYAEASGVEVTAHHYDHVGDTSYIFLKIPRRRYKLSFHNCSGNDADSPTTKTKNPKKWLEEHENFLLSHNCNCGGLSDEQPGEWGSRWNGTEYPKTNTDSRNFFAFDSETGDCAFYPASIYDSEDLFADVPAKYDIIFGIGDYFVLNGTARTSAFTLDKGANPRTCFGWDKDYYYVLSCEGRGTYERGLELEEARAIFVAHNVANAVNFDGGGSVCLAARIGGTVEKINRFRDCSLPYPELRAVGLCAAYERRVVE